MAASTSARNDGVEREHCVLTVPLPSGQDAAVGPEDGVGVGVGWTMVDALGVGVGCVLDPPVGEPLPPPHPKAPIPTTSASLPTRNRVFSMPNLHVHATQE